VGEVQRHGGDPPSPFEEKYGFSRVIVVDGQIHLGGTTAVGPLGAIIGETPYDQMAECLRKAFHEFSRLGAMPEDIISVRAYVTDISRYDEVGRAFNEALGEVAPLFTMVEVSSLIDPRMSVEVEATALAPDGGAG
jgi:enamine deaminase RidA (YjgF/YER057c/UK114 family)